MRDEIDGRIWAEHHQGFSEDLGRFFDAIGTSVGTSVGTALRRLNEIEFEAPWKRDLRGPGQA